MNLLIGLIGIFIGFLLVWKANWIYQNFGKIDWAERHLSSDGGTRLLWKLIGLGIIIISTLLMFGLMGGIITAIFSPFFRGRNI
ncbi:hypothetical protein KKF32_04465 [Patescibacteria group bacterium]|nr:hypothetical protein [Patescibacteria group bacterium]